MKSIVVGVLMWNFYLSLQSFLETSVAVFLGKCAWLLHQLNPTVFHKTDSFDCCVVLIRQLLPVDDVFRRPYQWNFQEFRCG
jgi:hypothetical protein